MYNFSKIFISLFGIGFFPFAPGTMGTFFSLILFYFIINQISTLVLILIFFLVFFVSIFFINIYSDKNKIYDSSEIVIDEFLGILTILIFYNFIKFTNDLIMFSLIFLLFRFFDIIKIYPANIIDKKFKNSLGVILDDLVAGVYCVFILFLVNVFK